MRTLFATAVLFLMPVSAPAQDAPEALLPSGTQLYLRWDGVDAHRDAYDKTALGKMMQGDMGVFLQGVFEKVKEGLGSVLTVEQLLSGTPPEKLAQMQADANEAAKLFSLIGKHGFILALHLGSLEPPQGQVTFIIPNGGDDARPVIGAMRLIATLNRIPVQEKKIGQRTVYHIPTPIIHIAWWNEGKHAVVNVGTETPEQTIARFEKGADSSLASNPMFKQVSGFKDFRTSARMFLDVDSLVKIAKTRGPAVAKLLDELGVSGLRSVVLYSGFDGDSERGLVEVDMPGPRKGLLSLLEGKSFTFADLPPLPPDVTSFTMTNIHPGQTYDVIIQALEQIIPMIDPDAIEDFRSGLREMNLALGIDLRKDLLESLGGRLAYYISPSEGPLNLGATLLIQVKDADKAKESIEAAIKGLAKTAGGDVRLQRRTYRGVEVHEVHVKTQGFFFVPTYAVHKDWLIVSYFPQPVHGYILRATGEIDSWKPSDRVTSALGKMPKEFTSISFSDPRPSMKELLSLAPFIGGLVNSFNPEAIIEMGTLPNAQEATRHLFPNVSVSSDDGKILRIESRASLSLPLELTGIDTYIVIFAFGTLARF